MIATYAADTDTSKEISHQKWTALNTGSTICHFEDHNASCLLSGKGHTFPKQNKHRLSTVARFSMCWWPPESSPLKGNHWVTVLSTIGRWHRLFLFSPSPACQARADQMALLIKILQSPCEGRSGKSWLADRSASLSLSRLTSLTVRVSTTCRQCVCVRRVECLPVCAPWHKHKLWRTHWHMQWQTHTHYPDTHWHGHRKIITDTVS